MQTEILYYPDVRFQSRGTLVNLSRDQATRFQDSLDIMDERTLAKHGQADHKHGFRRWIEIKLDKEFGTT